MLFCWNILEFFICMDIRMHSSTTVDGKKGNFRGPLVKAQSFFSLCIFAVFLSWFSDFFQCTTCDVLLAYVLIINRECGCSYAHACAKQWLGVCLWTFVYAFLIFPQAWIYSLQSLLEAERGVQFPRSFEKLFSHWLSLCVLSPLFRWERGAVLL